MTKEEKDINMDIVITYVNGLDPVWQKSYEQYTNTPILEKRFRDWGTLKYLFRGIEKNMPFIRKVHLVVASESQVPEWVNRDVVSVVLHSDIIPAEYLPTFNSNTIEMHLHRINDLDEEFLYFNDDIFPMLPSEPTDYFRDGRGVIAMSTHLLALDMFKKICRNSDRVVRKALGMKPRLSFLRPQHTCVPMFRSENEWLYETIKPEILASLTATRQSKNITQYIFTNSAYLKGRIIDERQSKYQFLVGMARPATIKKFLLNPTHKLVCINDVRISEERYDELRATMLETFEELFPAKSAFEI